MEIDHNGLEVLARDECVRLIGTRAVARIGVSSGALPTILPVNYVVSDGEILLRTAAGTKLDTATRGAVVAFEVDEVDDEQRAAWSVVVTGVASERRPDLVDRRALDRLDRWPPRGATHVVAIPLDRVTGRRLVTPDEPERVGPVGGDGR